MSIKTRSKNFSADEISTLVDLVQENKSKLFGSLSSSLTYEEKNNVWKEIAEAITQAHGILRSKEDVAKKWSNVLAKHKPLISDKISSARKTGGGSPEAEFTELEEKLKSIKGKELFVGIVGGIDICSSQPISPLSASDMSISEEIKPPRKRHFSEERTNPAEQDMKKLQEKIELLRSIDNKMDRMVDLLGQLVGFQGKSLIPQMHQNTMHAVNYRPADPTHLLPPLPPQPYPPMLMQQHFPCNNNDL